MNSATLRAWTACTALLCCLPLAARAQAAPETEATRQAMPTPTPDSKAETGRAALAEALARYAHEPSVADVVHAALSAQRNDPARLEAMASRARFKGLIPDVQLGARRGQGVDLRPTSTAADVEGVRLSTDDDLVLEATLRFELGRLLFADEEVSIAREARAARSGRDELARQIVELYFRRKRLLLERDLAGRNDVDHEVRIAEAEALLDAFTSGAFRRMMVPRHAASTTWTTDAAPHATPSQ